jgi:Guanine nucleotide exchange factor synembryn.
VHDLLEVSFSHYLPGAIDPDDPELREQCKKEGLDNSLDDVLSPLVVLMTRLSIADEPSRVRIREWIVPTDLDRTGPLEARADLLGRCLRLLGSVYHPRLKDAVGEFLFAMCDSDGAKNVLCASMSSLDLISSQHPLFPPL